VVVVVVVVVVSACSVSTSKRICSTARSASRLLAKLGSPSIRSIWTPVSSSRVRSVKVWSTLGWSHSTPPGRPWKMATWFLSSKAT
jgi:hypothetical protein